MPRTQQLWANLVLSGTWKQCASWESNRISFITMWTLTYVESLSHVKGCLNTSRGHGTMQMQRLAAEMAIFMCSLTRCVDSQTWQFPYVNTQTSPTECSDTHVAISMCELTHTAIQRHCSYKKDTMQADPERAHNYYPKRLLPYCFRFAQGS